MFVRLGFEERERVVGKYQVLELQRIELKHVDR